ncbi:DUF1934 domain-containing protein [Clostridium sp. DJ247]|uniref:DUF1934 domain-containing protein n=1 Tax=Clostridium sp. DJ247 TaxID=2726188 RepID=UPI001623236E|nr:DUF1934 domain-containing protein [Clostridium sp. DJ247]MBC2579885.1 DUF1934 family protein [Clostridium sp. DJ247]
MNKKAIVSISSKQVGNEEEAIEVVTPGDFYYKDNLYYAVYEETTISGMEGTTTTLKIGKNTLSLIRVGNTSAKMEFEEKRENISMYNTPYGTIELRIKTNNLNINIDNNGGDIFIDYHMSVSGQSSQNTLLSINIKTQDQN